MLTQTASGLRAWRADTIDAPEAWHCPLSEDALSILDKVVREWQEGQPITDLRPPDRLHEAAAESLEVARAALEIGRGFTIITAGQPGRYSPRELQAVYWLVGQLLGRPLEQNVQGALLYDVRDTGQDVRYGARFESTFHTDNSFGDEVLDYVGLLCLRPAKSGGESQLVSGYSVINELLARHREAVEVLGRPFHVDRRGGLRPGDEPTARFPVFGGGGELLVRYLRFWIEAGHEKAGVPLTMEQVNALDALDRVANERRLRVEFTLAAGEMLFVNNRWILHNRTAFEDHAEPERQRHYVRLWLSARRDYPSEVAIQARSASEG
jgi:alpha-ketoglutarate-dependent taurine dioxygenase